MVRVFLRIGLVGALLTAAPAMAQEEAPAAEAPAADASADLARQLSNPIASLISVPFQQNFDFGLGPDGDGSKMTLNFQPVVPIPLSKDWNMIVRTIVPLVAQDDVAGPNQSQSGLGDTTQSIFFSPSTPTSGGIVWGVGPVFLYPTATNRALGADKWGVGPSVVVLTQKGRNTFGLLANHLWSVAGDELRPDISTSFVQPFVSHTTASATTFTLNTETTFDWLRESWLVPINLSVSQLTRMGKQPVSIGAGAKYYAAGPDGAPNWGLRLTFVLLFPRK